MAFTVGPIEPSSFQAATITVTGGHSPSRQGPFGGSGEGTRYRTVRRVNMRKPITTPGMYASRIGITHAMTGPIASSRSERQGAENQTPNPTYAAVRQSAIANRTVGRPPTPGRRRRVKLPSGAGRPASCCDMRGGSHHGAGRSGRARVRGSFPERTR